MEIDSAYTNLQLYYLVRIPDKDPQEWLDRRGIEIKVVSSCSVTRIQLDKAADTLRLIRRKRQHIDITQRLLVVLGPFLHTI